MAWVTDALKSSIGKKIVMALSGLLLSLFLIAHLGGNLLMYVGPEAYNLYAESLHSQEWLIKIAEVGLVVLFGLHIWLALETNKENRDARPQGYAVKKSKVADRKIPLGFSPENFMTVSGIVILIFLIWHIFDFALDITWSHKTANLNHFDKAIVILRNPVTTVIYVSGVAFLGWHLAHAITSMFQTLGLKHPKYDPLTKTIGSIFAWVIFLGFASIPIYFWFSPYQPAEPTQDQSVEETDGHTQRMDLKNSLVNYASNHLICG